MDCDKLCSGEQLTLSGVWRLNGFTLRKGGGNMVTYEALTCMFTLGLLIVAIIALKQSK